uniref:Serpin domain-containing protein n=1 Tax=Megaselia scalaris TaxID=36166 RepID=T1GIR9_MEGSC
MKIFLKLGILVVMSLSAYSSEEPLFATDLYKAIGENGNMVFSPYSIQACLGLAYMGAGGQTASEMAKGLRFGSMTKDQVADSFSKVLKDSQSSNMLKIANKIYVNKGSQINFAKSIESEKVINDWVEKETNGKIKDLLSPGTIDQQTKAILVNAIYFKGHWESPFPPKSTRKLDFYSSSSKAVQADFMYDDDRFLYGSLDDLDATAVELKYKDSPYSMVFVLPNEKDGLPKLVKKIGNNYDLLSVSKKLSKQKIYIYLPKFEVEYDIELKPALSKLGMPSMFSRKADFNSMFKDSESIYISKAFHKAMIRVDEDGTEAAAATCKGTNLKAYPMSMFLGQKTFKADHPFLWYIKDESNIYFMGQVTTF